MGIKSLPEAKVASLGKGLRPYRVFGNLKNSLTVEVSLLFAGL
jgi:hypothetical protein